ncbi:MAG: 4Fe-4S binding protein [Archaeoglobi archaeon]|nr:4Fe-4S binding protein [Candidatus Mnemosynella sp.]
MGVFVKVELNPEKCSEPEKLAEICPVDIFAVKDGKVVVVEENEDECTFCNLCVQYCPEGVKYTKLY